MTERKVQRSKLINGAKEHWPAWLRTVAYIAVAILAGLYAADQRVDAIDTRVAVIEANRFTTGDGTTIWEALARIQERDEGVFRRLDNIDGRLTNIERALIEKGTSE